MIATTAAGPDKTLLACMTVYWRHQILLLGQLLFGQEGAGYDIIKKFPFEPYGVSFAEVCCATR